MSENTEQNAQHGDGHEDGHHVNYFKIYVTLVVLFLISVAGPELGIRWVTLVTAFGIAVVKANLVINNFMHLKWEKRLMKWMLATSLILMFLMVAGISPDVLNHEGRNWENVAAQEAVAAAMGEGDHGEGEEAVVADAGEAEPAGFNAAASFGTICSTCHGTGGQGDGPAGAALDPAPADFTEAVFWEDRDRDRILTVIRDGAAAVGGSALMAPWGALYTAEQLEEITDYVMSFRPE